MMEAKQRARLTFAGGKVREVHLFSPSGCSACSNSSDRGFESWSKPRITGTLRIGETVQDVEIDPREI